MLETFCARCGGGNNLTAQFCVRCGTNLAFQSSSASTPQTSATQPWQPFRNPLQPLQGIQPFSVGEVVSSTLHLLTKQFWLVTRIVFVVFAPFEIFKVVSLVQGRTDWQTSLLRLFLGAVCHILVAPPLIYALLKFLETGTAAGVNESFRWGLTKVSRLAVCAAISYVLQALGYMLCFIPGIIVSLTLAVVYPVAVLESGSPEDVLKRSSALTGGYRTEILFNEILLGLVGLAIGLPISVGVANIDWPPLTVVGGIFIDIVEQSFTVLSLVMYLSLIRTPRQGRLLLPLPN